MNEPSREQQDTADGRTVPDAHAEHNQRDGEALLMMGGFFLLLGLTVLAATQWEKCNEPAGALNIAAAVGLLVVGVGMGLFSRHVRRNSGRSTPTDSP